MQTLAERLAIHLQHPAPEPPAPDGVAGFLGWTMDARALLDRWFGRDFPIVSGVRLAIPPDPQWSTRDAPDGSVAVQFSNPFPLVVAEFGPLAGRAELTACNVRISAAAVEIVLSLRRYPNFTYTVRLS